MGVRADSSSHGIIEAHQTLLSEHAEERIRRISLLCSLSRKRALGGRFDAAPFSEGELWACRCLTTLVGAALSASWSAQIKHGDHTVFVGAVKSARLLADGDALTMWLQHRLELRRLIEALEDPVLD